MRRLPVLLLTLLSGLLLATPAVAAAPEDLGGGSRLTTCTAAFAATDSAGSGYLIGGPRCGPVGTNLDSGGVLVGPVVAVTSSGASVVHVTNPVWHLVGWVGGPTPFHGSTEAPVGSAVCLAGLSSGYHCGTITARNVTVAFPTGTVTGLTRTTVCTEPGDAAATFVSNGQAQGVLIGASGNCTSGGTSFFAPINPILAARALHLLI